MTTLNGKTARARLRRTPLSVAQDLQQGLSHEGAVGAKTVAIQLSCLLAINGLRTPPLALSDDQKMAIAAGKDPQGLSDAQDRAMAAVAAVVIQPEDGSHDDNHLFAAPEDQKGRKWGLVRHVEVDRELLLEQVEEFLASPPEWAATPLPVIPISKARREPRAPVTKSPAAGVAKVNNPSGQSDAA